MAYNVAFAFLAFVLVETSNIGINVRYEKVNQAYPSISDLHSLLGPLTESRSLTLIDNHRYIDLAESIKSSPVILRKQVTVATYKEPDLDQYVCWGSENASNRRDCEGIRYSRVPPQCHISLFFYRKPLCDDERNTDICLRINLKPFSMASKPWNCEAHFRLFPESLLNDASIVGPPIFHRNYNNPFYSNGFSPTVPPLHFFIHFGGYNEHANLSYQEKIITYFNIKMINRQRSDSDIEATSFHSNDILFFINIESINSQSTTSSRSNTISDIYLADMCKNCYKMDGSSTLFGLRRLNIFSFTTKVLTRANKIQSLLFAPTNEQLWWYYENLLFGCMECEGVMESFLEEVSRCEDKNFFNKKHRITTFDVEKSQLTLGVFYAEVWLSSVMTNYTYSSIQSGKDPSSVCNNGIPEKVDEKLRYAARYVPRIRINVLPQRRRTYFMPYEVSREIGALKYITCADRGLSGILFSELTNVYDNWIWLSILISITATAVSTSFISIQKRELSENLLSVFKVLVEQGDPFTSVTIKDRRLKIILGLFMLTAIVISNGYKNTNVYNMVTPRMPVPYRTFDEITNDNVTIYTKGSSLDLRSQDDINFGNLTFFEYHNINDKLCLADNNNVVCVQPETIAMDQKYSGFYHSRKVVSVVNTTLLKRARLHSSLQNTLKVVLTKVNTSLSGVIINDVPFGEHNIKLQLSKLLAKFYQAQMNELMGDLGKCQKTVLVLPLYMTGKYPRRFKSKRQFYVGKETFSDMTWTLSLGGVVPPYILQKIKSVEEAGIWERWKILIVGDTASIINSHVEEEASVSPANLKGNILVLFAVWLVGIMVTLPILGWEFRIQIKCWIFEIIKLIKLFLLHASEYLIRKIKGWKNRFKSFAFGVIRNIKWCKRSEKLVK